MKGLGGTFGGKILPAARLAFSRLTCASPPDAQDPVPVPGRPWFRRPGFVRDGVNIVLEISDDGCSGDRRRLSVAGNESRDLRKGCQARRGNLRQDTLCSPDAVERNDVEDGLSAVRQWLRVDTSLIQAELAERAGLRVAVAECSGVWCPSQRSLTRL